MAGGKETHGEDDDTDENFPPKYLDGYDGELMGDPDEEIVQECCPNLNRDLLVNKFWYFFFFGANGSLMPYLILYFKQLGLTPSQVGIVSGLKPFISFVCSPIWGYIADKSNKTKFIYIISILAYGAGYVAYSFAPSKHICSLRTNVSKNHEEGMMTHIHRRNVITDSGAGDWYDRNDMADSKSNAPIDSKSNLHTDSYQKVLTGSTSNRLPESGRAKRELLGLDHYFRRKLFPERMKRLPMYTNIRNKSLPHKTVDRRHFNTLPHLMYPAENEYSLFQVPASMQILTLAEEKTPNDTAAIDVGQTNTGKVLAVVTGKESWVGAVRHHKSPWTVCAAAKANAIDSVSLSAAKEKPENLSSIFSYLLIITLIATIFSCPLITIVDTATIRKLKETCETHLYGKQRLWGSFAWGIFSFSIGAFLSLLPLCGSKHNEVNYFPAFYIFAGLLTVAMVIGLRLKFTDYSSVGDDPIEGAAQPCSSRTQKIVEGLKMLREPIYGYFIFTSFFIGMTMSIIKTFLFWHLKDLGAPQILFSIIAAVNCVAEVFVYYFSSLFIKRVGHIKVLYISLICYSLRLFYYGLLKKPWYVLAAEPLSGITTAAAWATMTSYVGMNANPESVTTMQGILHGVHWGLGHGCGELLGGFMVSWVGAAMTFNLFGIASILQLLLFMLVNSLASKRCRSDEVGQPAEEDNNLEVNND